MMKKKASTCAFLGIYPEYIEDAGDSLDNLMQQLNFSQYDYGRVWREIEYDVSEMIDGENITNSIISTIFGTGISMICMIGKLDRDDFDYYVNGMDSHLYYKQEEY